MSTAHKTQVQLVTSYAIASLLAQLHVQVALAPRGAKRYLLINDANVVDMPLTTALSAPAFLADAGISAVKTVAGCACCLGALAWRTELARMLRAMEQPAALWIVSNHWQHLDAMETQLQAPPFDAHIRLLPRLIA